MQLQGQGGQESLNTAAGTVYVSDSNAEFANEIMGTIDSASRIAQGMQLASGGLMVGRVAASFLPKARKVFGNLVRTFGKRQNVSGLLHKTTRAVHLPRYVRDGDLPLVSVRGKAFRATNADGPYDANYLGNDPLEHARFKAKTGTGYFALDSAGTAAAEMAYHGKRNIQLYANMIEYDSILDLTDPAVRSRFSGTFLHEIDNVDGTYRFSERFADYLVSKGVNGVIYPSARLHNGTNLAVFVGHGAKQGPGLQNIDIGDLIR